MPEEEVQPQEETPVANPVQAAIGDWDDESFEANWASIQRNCNEEIAFMVRNGFRYLLAQAPFIPVIRHPLDGGEPFETIRFDEERAQVLADMIETDDALAESYRRGRQFEVLYDTEFWDYEKRRPNGKRMSDCARDGWVLQQVIDAMVGNGENAQLKIIGLYWRNFGDS